MTSSDNRDTKQSPEIGFDDLLDRISSGDASAADDLLPMLYGQLRAIAAAQMATERPGHTLQATALVHEAFLKLAGPRKVSWQNQAHFYAAAAEAMRRILVDHARGRNRQKRDSSKPRIMLNVLDLAASENSEDILALDEALRRLETHEPDAANVVRLRFFAGLSVDQTAEALDVSPRTIDRRWKFARAWLYRELNHSGD